MTSAGLYCEAGGFHIDPCAPVARAIVTHAHADHIVNGCRQLVTALPGVGLLQSRLSRNARVEGWAYGASVTLGATQVSLHPAGHILGSTQVRVEHRGEIWVVTGDYKTTPEPTCHAFEPVRCHTLITESTFGHPFFRWPDPRRVIVDLQTWWQANQTAGLASIVYAYALGKAQRVLAALDHSIGPIALHDDVATVCRHYSEAGIPFPPTIAPTANGRESDWSRTLFVLPPSARWRQPFPYRGHYATAFVSGWMLLPDGPARRHVQTGFPLSDHADHAEIHATIAATQAERIGVMHGYIEPLVSELLAAGRDAFAIPSPRCSAPPFLVPGS